MLPIAKLHYRRVGDTPKGNLVYILRDAQPFLAVTIEHSGAHGPFPAALVINDAAGEQRMPLVDVTCQNQYCVDTGLQAAAVWSPPLAVVPQDTVLFNSTIATNIAVGKDSATPAEIENDEKSVVSLPETQSDENDRRSVVSLENSRFELPGFEIILKKMPEKVQGIMTNLR